MTNKFYTNFDRKDYLRMEFTVQENEMMQQGSLTSFALHEAYRTHTEAHDQ